MSVVSSNHQEEVLLANLELDETVEVSVHRDGVTSVVPNFNARRNIDEVVDKKSTFLRFTVEQHWQCVEAVYVEE